MDAQPRLSGGVQPPPESVSSRDDAGVALLVTVLILLVVSILGAAVVNLGRVDYTLSSNYRSSMAALNLADSGLSSALADLRADYYADPTDNWLVDWLDLSTSPPSVPAPFPEVAGTVVNGYALTPASVDPDPYPGTPYELGGPSPLGSGTFRRTIWLPPTVTMEAGTPVVHIRVRSTGVDGNAATPANAVVDGVVTIELADATPYSSAAFLGAGEGGDLMRGGPVHIAGTVVAVGEPDRRDGVLGWLLSGTRLNLANGSKIVNNYRGIDDASALGALYGKLPALSSIDLDGEAVESLGASLRLKDVTTFMTRSGGQLGEPDVGSDPYKETLDGVYTDDPIMPDTANVHADTVAGSDLADELVFPSLTAPYTDAVSGAAYASFAAFLDGKAYEPITGGEVTISSATPSFSWIDPAGNGALEWDAALETLSIDGIVKINGTVSFGDPTLPGGDQLGAIHYQGTGVIWATDDVLISKDIYPAGQFLEDGPDADEAIDGNLGIISSDEIVIDGSAPPPLPGRGVARGRGGGLGVSGTGDGNLQVLATLFAERRLRAATSANVAGSVVTNAINVDSRATLRIWHVPTLAGNAAPGMPVGMMIADIEVALSGWFQRR